MSRFPSAVRAAFRALVVPALGLALSLPAHAVTYIDWDLDNSANVIVDPTNPVGSWALVEDGVTYNCYTKGVEPDGKSGHPPLAPWLSSVHRLGTAGFSLAYKIPATTATGVVDDTKSDKLSHRIISAGNVNAPSFTQGRAIGFGLRLGDGQANSFQSVGARLLFFQCWQGLGNGQANPPLFLDLKPYQGGGTQVVRVRTKNDSHQQSQDADVFQLTEFPLTRDQWHRFVIEMKPGYLGSNQPGYVRIWLNGVQVVNWTGYWGYKPTSAGGGINLNDRMDMHTMLYRARQDRTQTLFFDNVKMGDSAADVQP